MIKMFMNNIIILLLAVRICEDSDKRGSDKRGYTVPQIVAVDFFSKINGANIDPLFFRFKIVHFPFQIFINSVSPPEF